MKHLHVGVVIPCLNEERTLAATAASLGFGKGDPPAKTYLVLVDNGSTDDTLRVSKLIQAKSPRGRVIIGHERIRGYVPPRHRGNLIMQKVARSQSLSDSDVLVLQGDADTLYSAGYINELRNSSLVHGSNSIVEGCIKYATGFLTAHVEYAKLCNQVDAEFDSLLADHPDDVILDDKACGYRLSDYFQWGGHRREFDRTGDEIHAETTRLYIRAKRTNCRRIRVTGALARHSTRKEVENPSFAFATAGFPRETSWRKTWRRIYKGTDFIDDFANRKKNVSIDMAIQYRRQHLLALFLMLPLHVSQSLGLSSQLNSHPDARKMLSQLPRRSKRCCLTHPGMMIEDVLRFVDLE